MYWFSYDPATAAEMYEAHRDRINRLMWEERQARRKRGLTEPGEEETEEEEEQDDDII